MQVQPYLFFEGRCEEALEFYRAALGATVSMLIRFKESPEPPPPGAQPPGSGDKIMHACFRVGETDVMASDGNCSGQAGFRGFSLSISVGDEAQAARMFNGLAAGGSIQMPLAKTFFAHSFGMVTDRFGVCWMVIVPL